MTNENIYLTDMELMRLNDCAASTRMGMVDQGFPAIMKKLAALKLVDKKGEGHVVNEAGLLVLATNKERLFLSKRRKRYVDRYEADDGDLEF